MYFTCSICLATCYVMQKPSYYISKIKEELTQKQKHNPHYSLRAYARDLGMHPATLSQVIKGTRPLPLKNSLNVTRKLALGPREKTLFMESLLRSKTKLDEIKISPLDERFILDESYHQVIAEWEHFALLELFNLDEFIPTFDEIKKRLSLSTHRTEVVIHNLLTAGLLKKNHHGQYEKVHSDIRTTEDIKNNALKESHRENLKIANEKLDTIELELRDFSSSTLAIDLKKLPEAKTIIREFRQKMTSLLRDGKKTDIYQLAIQFYPLTPTKKENIQENL
mgnify:CR=1 FL=1